MPQTTPNMGGILGLNTRSNPPAYGWSNQPSGQASTQVPFYTPTSSVPILTNAFGMANPLI
jgi:hypothetical protein